MKLAKEATDLAPADFNVVNTLGTAEFRAGRLKEAIEALEKSERLSGGTQLGFQAYVMAMAHWQLGEKDEAHIWYDRGIEWMKKNQWSEPALLGFRDEAARLLGHPVNASTIQTSAPRPPPPGDPGISDPQRHESAHP